MDFKKHYFTERRQYASKHGQQIMYHGTTDKNLKSILSNGLVPTKEKVWKDDPEASFDSPSRQSYGGTYFTNNLITSISSARNAVSKIGGKNRIIVIAKLQPRTAIPDEDTFSFKVNNAVGKAISEGKFSPSHETVNLNAYINAISDKSYLNYYLKEFTNSLKRSIEYDSDEIWPNVIDEGKLKNLFLAALKRKIAYIDSSKFSYFDEYEDHLNSIKKSEAESEFRNALDSVLRMFKKETYKDTGDINKTFRIEEPVNYKGKNKIIAIVELQKHDDIDKKDVLKVRYGEVPDQFLNDYKTHIGEYKLEK